VASLVMLMLEVIVIVKCFMEAEGCYCQIATPHVSNGKQVGFLFQSMVQFQYLIVIAKCLWNGLGFLFLCRGFLFQCNQTLNSWLIMCRVKPQGDQLMSLGGQDPHGRSQGGANR